MSAMPTLDGGGTPVRPSGRAAPSWPFAKRFSFAFAFVFILLVNLPAPFYVIPGSGRVVQWVSRFWNTVVPPVATGLFHLRVTLPVAWNDSVDTTFHYAQYVLCIAFALLAAALWSALDRDPGRFDRAHRLFGLYVRYTLALAMLKYGAAKVVGTQFPYPSLDTLVETYGASSPMGLAWMFMGMSPVLKFLAGVAEMLSGVFLTIRRTALLGALLAILMMSSVVAMNYCYDVPVKTYATQLLVMAFIVAWPALGRLAAVLVLNRPVASVEMQPLFRDRTREAAMVVVRTIIVIAVAVAALRSEQRWRQHSGDLAPRSPLRGIWNVDLLEVDSVARPPLTTDDHRWRRLVFDGPERMSIFDMDDTRHLFQLRADPAWAIVTLANEDDPGDTVRLACARPNRGTLVVDSLVQGHRLHAVCHLMDETKFVLTSRRFHWVDEVPFFR